MAAPIQGQKPGTTRLKNKVHSSFYDLHMTDTNMSMESSVIYKQIQEILGGYYSGGEIKFDSFEDFYKEHWGLKLNYHFYGLANLDHLCEALKDILEVDFDCSGVKVIKAVKWYNLRKRKYWM